MTARSATRPRGHVVRALQRQGARRNTGSWAGPTQVLATLIDPPAIALPAAQLDEYAGTYQLTEAIRYPIRRDDEHLIDERTGRPAQELRVEARDVMFVPGQPRSRKIFQRDGRWAVADLGRRHLPALPPRAPRHEVARRGGDEVDVERTARRQVLELRPPAPACPRPSPVRVLCRLPWRRRAAWAITAAVARHGAAWRLLTEPDAPRLEFGRGCAQLLGISPIVPFGDAPAAADQGTDCAEHIETVDPPIRSGD